MKSGRPSCSTWSPCSFNVFFVRRTLPQTEHVAHEVVFVSNKKHRVAPQERLPKAIAMEASAFAALRWSRQRQCPRGGVRRGGFCAEVERREQGSHS